jgi:hypothetical protein
VAEGRRVVRDARNRAPNWSMTTAGAADGAASMAVMMVPIASSLTAQGWLDFQ